MNRRRFLAMAWWAAGCSGERLGSGRLSATTYWSRRSPSIRCAEPRRRRDDVVPSPGLHDAGSRWEADGADDAAGHWELGLLWAGPLVGLRGPGRDVERAGSDSRAGPRAGRGPRGLAAGVCDVVPEFHPPTGTVLAMGHVVFYRGAGFSNADSQPAIRCTRSAATTARGRRVGFCAGTIRAERISIPTAAASAWCFPAATS